MPKTDKAQAEKLGILAGAGRFPVYLAQVARKKGYRVIVIGPEGRLEPGIEDHADKVRTYRFARFGELLEVLKEEQIRQAMMAGKFEKRWLYQPGLELDDPALAMLKRIPDHQDDTLMNIVLNELTANGIEILDTISLIQDWLAPAGKLTEKEPDEKQWQDIRFGWKIAKGIGRLDLGQTVAVLDRAVLAVEAIEGTDQTILRAGQISPGAVIVKVLKPGQSLKYDVPVAGLSTIESMIQARASVLALEAGACLIVEREEMIKLADQNGICLVGVKVGTKVPRTKRNAHGIATSAVAKAMADKKVARTKRNGKH